MKSIIYMNIIKCLFITNKHYSYFAYTAVWMISCIYYNSVYNIKYYIIIIGNLSNFNKQI